MRQTKLLVDEDEPAASLMSDEMYHFYLFQIEYLDRRENHFLWHITHIFFHFL